MTDLGGGVDSFLAALAAAPVVIPTAAQVAEAYRRAPHLVCQSGLAAMGVRVPDDVQAATKSRALAPAKRGASRAEGRVSDARAQPCHSPTGRGRGAPPAELPGQSAERRTKVHRLRQAAADLHPYDVERGQASRVYQCGKVPVRGGTESLDAYIGEGKNGAHALYGTQSCCRLWECAVCRARAGAKHLDEIRQAVTAWMSKPGHRVYFGTFTATHHEADELVMMRKGLASAWGGMTTDRAWVDLRAEHGFHYVRALDATVGRNGWHLHYHCLFFTTSTLETHKVKARIGAKWRRYVELKIGPKHVPSRKHGVRLVRMRDADALPKYLAKLGLELTNDLDKKARRGSQSPWEILGTGAELRERARLLTQSGERGDARELNRSARRIEVRWHAWWKGMSGARWMAWSNGLRDAVALGAELSDAQAVEAGEGAEVGDVAQAVEAVEAQAEAALDLAARSVKARIPASIRKAILYHRTLIPCLLDACDKGLPLMPFIESYLGAQEAAEWEAANEPTRLYAWARQRKTPKRPDGS